MFVNHSLKNKNTNIYMTAQSKTALLDGGCTHQLVNKNPPFSITKENKPPIMV
jgi:hypothetical protein